MKILLAAVNAKFNHTNIAVRSIAGYARGKIPVAHQVEFGEWTINMPPSEILRGLVQKKPDMIIFSTYIWNSEIIQKLIPDIKKVIPKCTVGAGGPEAGFNADQWLKKLGDLDFVIAGEGEETSLELFCGTKSLQDIGGIYLRNSAGKVIFTGERHLICNLDDIPFPYERIEDPENKIHYYESSRGCPFSCAYCMSSLDKRVRFHSLERVCKDLQTFLDAKTCLVKFVDRTYNLNTPRYIAIWQYILDHHNGKTKFHFEIEAEYLDDEALQFLQKVPDGIMQFEIGVQSCNQKTLEAVGRSKETEKLFANIRRIPKTIPVHLDLIAGLPFEGLDSFGDSLEKVLSLKPDELQLGFLKVLHGTSMEQYALKNGWQWMENPNYEILSTPELSYDGILFLKDVETIVDALYNSGLFETTVQYAGRKLGWKNFFYTMAKKSRRNGNLDSPRKTNFWFDVLAEFFKDDKIGLELLKFDYLKNGKTSCFPSWLEHNYDKKRHLDAMIQNENRFGNRIEFAFSEYDEFAINPLEAFPEKTAEKKAPASSVLESDQCFRILFVYPRHNSKIKGCQILLPHLQEQ